MGVGFRDDFIQADALPVLQALEQGTVLRYDNADLRRARVVNDLLQQQQNTHMDLPARSLDLNAIEHLWDILGDERELVILQQLTLTTCSTSVSYTHLRAHET